MPLSDQVQMRLDEIRSSADAARDRRGTMIDLAVTEKRGFTDTEQASHDALTVETRGLDAQVPMLEARVRELKDQEASEVRAAAARVEQGAPDPAHYSPARVEDAPVYVRGSKNGNSYFRDLARAATEGNEARDATDRLVRSARATAADQQRALGNTNATGGSGGKVLAAA